jgi:hypothetical protein
MTTTTRRVMFWSGIALVLGLGIVLAYLSYCKYRAVYRLDVLGVDRRVKPTGLPPPPAEYSGAVADPAPVEYETFEKRGVTDVHRVGAQIFNITKLPISALIVVGLLLIARALYRGRQPTSGTSLTIDPLAD